jgi:phage gp29-like protein
VIRDKLSIPKPTKGAKLLGVPAPVEPYVLAQAANREQKSQRPFAPRDIVDNQVQTLEQVVAVPLDDMVEQIKELLDSVNSLEEFRDRLIETYPMMTNDQLADAIADGLVAASLAGRYDIFRGL